MQAIGFFTEGEGVSWNEPAGAFKGPAGAAQNPVDHIKETGDIESLSDQPGCIRKAGLAKSQLVRIEMVVRSDPGNGGL